MKYNNNNNNNNINIKKYLYYFCCLILFLMFICIILLPLLFIYSGNNNINNNNNYNNNYNNKPLIINYSTKEIKEYIHYKQNKKLLTKLANKLSQTKQQQQNNKKNKKDNNNKKDKNNNNINNNNNNNIDLNNDLFEIAKTMPYTVKDKKDVKVITYYDDTPNCNVYGYTKYDKDTNTKIIGINLYTANTYKKVIETLYHESYSDKKHKLNEESAKAYSNHIAKRLKDIPDIDIDINKLNINKEELKENTKLAYNAFADYYTNKNTDVQFNTALIQDPIVNDIQQLLQLSPAIAISPEAVVIAAGTVSAYYAGKIIYTTVKDVIREKEEKRKLEEKQLNDNNNILEPRLISAAQEQENVNTKDKSVAESVSVTTGGGDNNRNNKNDDDDDDKDDEKLLKKEVKKKINEELRKKYKDDDSDNKDINVKRRKQDEIIPRKEAEKYLSKEDIKEIEDLAEKMKKQNFKDDRIGYNYRKKDFGPMGQQRYGNVTPTKEDPSLPTVLKDANGNILKGSDGKAIQPEYYEIRRDPARTFDTENKMRIVIEKRSGAVYYSYDHYKSFIEIVEGVIKK